MELHYIQILFKTYEWGQLDIDRFFASINNWSEGFQYGIGHVSHRMSCKLLIIYSSNLFL